MVELLVDVQSGDMLAGGENGTLCCIVVGALHGTLTGVRIGTMAEALNGRTVVALDDTSEAVGGKHVGVLDGIYVEESS